MPSFLFVGAVAARLNVSPHVVSYLFQMRRLDCNLCPVVAGRRLIPEEYVPEIAREVRRLKRRQRKAKP